MRRKREGLLLFALVTMLIGVAVTASAEIDKRKVYLGNPNSFMSPAEIRVAAVFNVIPEFRQISKENLTPRDARYWLLLNKANKRFNKALKATSEKYGYDIIAEAGTIGVYNGKPVPDITGEVLVELGE